MIVGMTLYVSAKTPAEVKQEARDTIALAEAQGWELGGLQLAQQNPGFIATITLERGADMVPELDARAIFKP